MNADGASGHGAQPGSVEMCTNCGRTIGRLETPYVWGESMVCATCHRLLSSESESHSPPESVRGGFERIWSIHDKGQQFGPHTEPEIAAFLAAGTISETALVWREGSPRWIPVSNIVPLPPTRSSVQATPGVTVNVNNINTNTTALVPVMAVRAPANGLGNAALVLGIIADVFFCIPFLSVPLGALGIVLGAIGIFDAQSNRQLGVGTAVGGVILCLMPMLFWLLVLMGIASAPSLHPGGVTSFIPM